MPRNAVTHIQNSAPGPPQCSAMATPAMLPMPTVADSAVDSAWKCETSPGSFGSSYLPVVTAKPWPRRRSWIRPSRRRQEQAGAQQHDHGDRDLLRADRRAPPDDAFQRADDPFEHFHAVTSSARRGKPRGAPCTCGRRVEAPAGWAASRPVPWQAAVTLRHAARSCSEVPCESAIRVLPLAAHAPASPHSAADRRPCDAVRGHGAWPGTAPAARRGSAARRCRHHVTAACVPRRVPGQRRAARPRHAEPRPRAGGGYLADQFRELGLRRPATMARSSSASRSRTRLDAAALRSRRVRRRTCAPAFGADFFVLPARVDSVVGVPLFAGQARPGAPLPSAVRRPHRRLLRARYAASRVAAERERRRCRRVHGAGGGVVLVLDPAFSERIARHARRPAVRSGRAVPGHRHALRAGRTMFRTPASTSTPCAAHGPMAP
jgi:hypothetical protein